MVNMIKVGHILLNYVNMIKWKILLNYLTLSLLIKMQNNKNILNLINTIQQILKYNQEKIKIHLYKFQLIYPSINYKKRSNKQKKMKNFTK